MSVNTSNFIHAIEKIISTRYGNEVTITTREGVNHGNKGKEGEA